MANGITMNSELFEALRKVGLEEPDALRLARAVPPAETIATKSDIADVRATIPDPEKFADKAATDEKFDRVLAEIHALREDIKDFRKEMEAEFKDVRKELVATNAKIDRFDERAKGDRKIFLIILAVLLAVGAGVFQLLLP